MNRYRRKDVQQNAKAGHPGWPVHLYRAALSCPLREDARQEKGMLSSMKHNTLAEYPMYSPDMEDYITFLFFSLMSLLT